MITWRFADVNKLPEESGIYMILNILNNHKYVGSTNNFKRRLTRHRGELRKDKHHSIYL
jgi:predicted GIY-YIG superfamily endonuclease